MTLRYAANLRNAKLDAIASHVLVRGPRGDRVWGVFASVETAERMWPEFPVETLVSVQEVTVSEVV